MTAGTSVDKVELDLRSAGGKRLAVLIIAAPGPSDCGAIMILSDHEAAQWSEQPVQLLEGTTYDYEIDIPHQGWRLRPGTVRRSALATPAVERGRIAPGLNTGTLQIVLENESGKAMAIGAIEVRSSKLDYRDHYRKMLRDIGRHAVDLVLDVRSSAATPVGADLRRRPDSAAQQLMFIREIVSGGSLAAAVARIAAQPQETMIVEISSRHIGRGIRSAPGLVRHLASAVPRVPLNQSHRLSSRLQSLPTQVPTPRPLPSLNTVENRFIKFVLASFERKLSEIILALQTADGGYDRVRLEAIELRRGLAAHIAEPFLAGVDDLFTVVPYASQVLQRRPGYREVFQLWVRYCAATALGWDAGADIYSYGKRNVATLYEYWVFFELIESVRTAFGISPTSLRELLTYDRYGLTLQLKTGRHISVEGAVTCDGRQFAVRFSYNRTFSRRPVPPGDPERSWPSAGSWTKRMRPDYTVTIWPAELSENSAEAVERIVHLHFDAKYRVEDLNQLFGDDSGDGDECEQEGLGPGNNSGDVKREDLLKMHAYRDAIRRSVSAFVLYPGSIDRRWRAFEAILPGLGAIAMTPGDAGGRQTVSDFLVAAVNLLTPGL